MVTASVSADLDYPSEGDSRDSRQPVNDAYSFKDQGVFSCLLGIYIIP